MCVLAKLCYHSPDNSLVIDPWLDLCPVEIDDIRDRKRPVARSEALEIEFLGAVELGRHLLGRGRGVHLIITLLRVCNLGGVLAVAQWWSWIKISGQ